MIFRTAAVAALILGGVSAYTTTSMATDIELELHDFRDVQGLPSTLLAHDACFVMEIHIGRTKVTVYDDDGVFGTLCILTNLKNAFYIMHQSNPNKKKLSKEIWEPRKELLRAFHDVTKMLARKSKAYKDFYKGDIGDRIEKLLSKETIRFKDLKVFDDQRKQVLAGKKRRYFNYKGDAYGTIFDIKFSLDGKVGKKTDYIGRRLPGLTAVSFSDINEEPKAIFRLSTLNPKKGRLHDTTFFYGLEDSDEEGVRLTREELKDLLKNLNQRVKNLESVLF